MAETESTFRAMIAGLEQQGFSRTEIAERAGISRQTLWRHMAGHSQNHISETQDRIKNVTRGLDVAPMQRK